MKIAILHHDLEWAERALHHKLLEKAMICELFDIRSLVIEDLIDFELIINRVYASVANRDYQSVVKTLSVLKILEKNHIVCVNSYEASKADYSKHYAFHQMQKKLIHTPKSVLLTGLVDIEIAKEFAFNNGYPVIVKRDTGGRAKGVRKADSQEELINYLKSDFTEGYGGKFIVQNFLKNIHSYDCRIAIIYGRFGYSSKRTLIGDKVEEAPWLASVARGSKQSAYVPSDEEIALSKLASEAIHSLINEVDIAFTKDGPAIIENNPTPSYDMEDEAMIDRLVELLIESVDPDLKRKR